MILCHFDRLRHEKGLRENRSLAILTVSQETGLSYNTLQRLRGSSPYRIQTSTIDMLCRYFDVDALTDFLEYRPDNAAGSQNIFPNPQDRTA